MTDEHKCTCPNCTGNCNNRRGQVKCVKCGAMKLKFRRCHNCERPIVYTAKNDPDAIKMYDVDILIEERLNTKPIARIPVTLTFTKDAARKLFPWLKERKADHDRR